MLGATTVAESQGVMVYNFTVADDHTYFVEGFGAATNSDGTTGNFAPLDAVWVHNNCNEPEDGMTERSPAELGLAQRHHIVSTYTNASIWTSESQDILTNASIDLNGERNIAEVAGHYGPHPEAYHFQVYEELRKAVESCEKGSDEYIAAVRSAPSGLKTRLANLNNPLTQLITH